MIKDKIRLHKAMTSAGYKPGLKGYTPQQLRILSEYLRSNPHVVADYVNKFKDFTLTKRL